MVELCTELFYAIIPTLFLRFFLICYPYILLHFCFSFLFMSLFLAADACMLELKFAICYRAASLPSQAFYAVLAEESQAFFKCSPHRDQQYF